MDPIVVQLRSVTIFWEDIGLPRLLSEPQKNMLAVWWDDEVDPWMKTAINHDCHPHETGVWFADPRDAALFKLRFSDQAPDIQ
jgi:hypothetical protein